jgi:hypothetical protein
MKKLLFILCFVVAALNVYADGPFPGVPYQLIGTLDADGHPHMKKGYHYYWTKVLEYDDYGRVYVKDKMVVTYKGHRLTD